MELHSTNRLTERQAAQIAELERICREYDGSKQESFLSSAFNFFQEMDCFFLLCDGEKLCGFLSVFAPTRDTAEVSACVLPSARRSGRFGALFAAARRELGRYGVKKVLFVHEASGRDGAEAIRKRGLELERSEYLMACDRETAVAPAADPADFSVRPAGAGDFERMAALNAEVFGESGEDARSMVKSTLENEQIFPYLAFLRDRPIGVCSVNFEGPRPSVFGLGIAPEFQGKGYGRALLNSVMRSARKIRPGELTLEVDSTNPRAFRLYATSGFTVKAQYDYYQYDLNE